MNDIKSRVLANVVRAESGCWVWAGRKDRHGYGLIKIGRTPRFAHRVSFEAWMGPIPEGLQIDHLCRVRDCCNPEHLEPVSSRENTMRSPVAPAAVNSRKTKCKNGHDLAGENLYVSPNGYRHCRECRRQASARWRAKGVAS